ncbi:MAG TPA: thioredoxin domain-containing protein [Thermoanaerobaculia bacterium]|nr:thioredoxin domain-containing protein [Thermoanaerobaculia bacterium]
MTTWSAPILFLFAAGSLQAAPPPADDKTAVVASAGAETVTVAEMETAARTSMIRLRQFEYMARRKAVEDVVFRKLLEQEARRQKITVVELRDREIRRKAQDVPETEIADLLKRAKGSLPDDPQEARARVVELVKEQREQGIETLYRRRLFARYGVEIFLPPPHLTVPLSASDPARGSVDAPVTIVEFSDFQCPGCRQARKMLAELQGSYGDKIRLIYKQFPLQGHTDAPMASQASLCAADQGKFWELHDWMFEHQDSLHVEALAEAVDLDREAFKNCVAGGTHAADVDRDLREGRELGISGTPTIFVNGREIMMNLSEQTVRDIVDEELRRSAAPNNQRSHTATSSP